LDNIKPTRTSTKLQHIQAPQWCSGRLWVRSLDK